MVRFDLCAVSVFRSLPQAKSPPPPPRFTRHHSFVFQSLPGTFVSRLLVTSPCSSPPMRCCHVSPWSLSTACISVSGAQHVILFVNTDNRCTGCSFCCFSRFVVLLFSFLWWCLKDPCCFPLKTLVVHTLAITLFLWLFLLALLF